MKEMTKALYFINARKAAAPTRVMCELLKVCEKENMKNWIRSQMIRWKRMPESWRSNLMPIYKPR